MLTKLLKVRGLRARASVETTPLPQSDKSELLELAIAILEAPPASAQTQDVLQRLDTGDIPFATAIERLRGDLAVAAATPESWAAAPAGKPRPGR